MTELAADFVVEVRDGNFARQGQIAPEYLDLMFVEVFRGVGAWELKLPNGHPLLPLLKTPGSGIIVTNRKTGRVYSGRMIQAVLSQDAADPDGTWVISGVDDSVVAAATIAVPDPANLPSAQTTAYWDFSGNGELVMKEAVRRNIGDLAIASRKYSWLTAAPNLNRGTGTVSVSVRFDNLGELLTSIGLKSNLGWSFYQVGNGVTFDVFVPQDKTGAIRLDIRNGGLESTELGWSAPSATTMMVLGQGEGAARTVRLVTSTESLAAQTAWKLRWEKVKDQRNTDDATELQQAGEEVLAKEGSTVNSLKVTPSDAPGQLLGTDWWLGDKVTVVIDGTPTQAIVNQVATGISTAGVIRQATVGDPVGFDWEAKVGDRLQQQDSRISALETTVEAGVTWASISGKPGIYAFNGGTIDATTPPSAFEVGVTIGQAGAGMPTSLGTVVVERYNDNRVVQTVTAKNADADQWVRTGDSALTDGWAPFRGGRAYQYGETIKYTSTGTFNKGDYPGLRAIKIRAVGGGGGGGGAGAAAASGHSAGGGGGGGGYAEKWALASAFGSSVTVTVGAGGAQGLTGGTGGNGGTSSFGSTTCVATGGQGGSPMNNYTTANVMAAAAGGDGGVGTNGDVLIAGSGGGLGTGLNTIGHGGAGGSSVLGGGAPMSYTGAGGGGVTGANGGNYGGGGAGATANASATARSGGAGAPGIVLIDLYY